MRHKVYGKHLGRTKNQRTALFKSLVKALIIAESIETTEAKAKSVKGLVDKIITQAKSVNTRRLVSSFLSQPKVEEKLMGMLPRLSGRSSGYSTIIKLGRRLGDGAMMVKMSLLLDQPKTVEAEVIQADGSTKTEATESDVVEVKQKKTRKAK